MSHLAISPIKGASGKLMGASAIAYDITERKKIEDERTKMIDQLNDTLSKVKTLSGLLPICARCKKIRDDKGYWQKLETFVHEHSNAEFSHSMCPDCMERLYPDFSKRRTASNLFNNDNAPACRGRRVRRPDIPPVFWSSGSA